MARESHFRPRPTDELTPNSSVIGPTNLAEEETAAMTEAQDDKESSDGLQDALDMLRRQHAESLVRSHVDAMPRVSAFLASSSYREGTQPIEPGQAEQLHDAFQHIDTGVGDAVPFDISSIRDDVDVGNCQAEAALGASPSYERQQQTNFDSKDDGGADDHQLSLDRPLPEVPQTTAQESNPAPPSADSNFLHADAPLTEHTGRPVDPSPARIKCGVDEFGLTVLCNRSSDVALPLPLLTSSKRPRKAVTMQRFRRNNDNKGKSRAYGASDLDSFGELKPFPSSTSAASLLNLAAGLGRKDKGKSKSSSTQQSYDGDHQAFALPTSGSTSSVKLPRPRSWVNSLMSIGSGNGGGGVNSAEGMTAFLNSSRLAVSSPIHTRSHSLDIPQDTPPVSSLVLQDEFDESDEALAERQPDAHDQKPSFVSRSATRASIGTLRLATMSTPNLPSSTSEEWAERLKAPLLVRNLDDAPRGTVTPQIPSTAALSAARKKAALTARKMTNPWEALARDSGRLIAADEEEQILTQDMQNDRSHGRMANEEQAVLDMLDQMNSDVDTFEQPNVTRTKSMAGMAAKSTSTATTEHRRPSLKRSMTTASSVRFAIDEGRQAKKRPQSTATILESPHSAASPFHSPPSVRAVASRFESQSPTAPDSLLARAQSQFTKRKPPPSADGSHSPALGNVKKAINDRELLDKSAQSDASAGPLNGLAQIQRTAAGSLLQAVATSLRSKASFASFQTDASSAVDGSASSGSRVLSPFGERTNTSLQRRPTQSSQKRLDRSPNQDSCVSSEAHTAVSSAFWSRVEPRPDSPGSDATSPGLRTDSDSKSMFGSTFGKRRMLSEDRPFQPMLRRLRTDATQVSSVDSLEDTEPLKEAAVRSGGDEEEDALVEDAGSTTAVDSKLHRSATRITHKSSASTLPPSPPPKDRTLSNEGVRCDLGTVRPATMSSPVRDRFVGSPELCVSPVIIGTPKRAKDLISFFEQNSAPSSPAMSRKGKPSAKQLSPAKGELPAQTASRFMQALGTSTLSNQLPSTASDGSRSEASEMFDDRVPARSWLSMNGIPGAPANTELDAESMLGRMQVFRERESVESAALPSQRSAVAQLTYDTLAPGDSMSNISSTDMEVEGRQRRQQSKASRQRGGSSQPAVKSNHLARSDDEDEYEEDSDVRVPARSWVSMDGIPGAPANTELDGESMLSQVQRYRERGPVESSAFDMQRRAVAQPTYDTLAPSDSMSNVSSIDMEAEDRRRRTRRITSTQRGHRQPSVAASRMARVGDEDGYDRRIDDATSSTPHSAGHRRDGRVSQSIQTPALEGRQGGINPDIALLLDAIKDNEQTRKAQQQQQEDIARYLNELNSWLERDVVDRSKEWRTLALGVTQLHDELSELKRNVGTGGAGLQALPAPVGGGGAFNFADTRGLPRQSDGTVASRITFLGDAPLAGAGGAGDGEAGPSGPRMLSDQQATSLLPTTIADVHGGGVAMPLTSATLEQLGSDAPAPLNVPPGSPVRRSGTRTWRSQAAPGGLRNDDVWRNSGSVDPKKDKEAKKAAGRARRRKSFGKLAALAGGAALVAAATHEYDKHKEKQRNAGRPSEASKEPDKDTGKHIKHEKLPAHHEESIVKAASTGSEDEVRTAIRQAAEDGAGAPAIAKLVEELRKATEEAHAKEDDEGTDVLGDGSTATDSRDSAMREEKESVDSAYTTKTESDTLRNAVGALGGGVGGDGALALAVEEILKHLLQKKEEERQQKQALSEAEAQRQAQRAQEEAEREERMNSLRDRERDELVETLLAKLQAEKERAEAEEATRQRELDPKSAIEQLVAAINTQRQADASQRASADATVKQLAEDLVRTTSDQNGKLVEAVHAAAREMLRNNVEAHAEDLKRMMSRDVAMMFEDVGKIREAKRALEMEMADLFLVKSKHLAGIESLKAATAAPHMAAPMMAPPMAMPGAMSMPMGMPGFAPAMPDLPAMPMAQPKASAIPPNMPPGGGGGGGGGPKGSRKKDFMSPFSVNFGPR